jgi:hypothetical protein
MTVKFSQNAGRFYIGIMCSRALCRCILANSPPKAACFRDVNDVNNVRCQQCQLLSTMSAVNHVNDVNRVNDVKTPTPAACGGVSAVTPPAAAVGGLRRLRLRFWGDACGGGSAVRPPAAAFGGGAACGGGFF